MKTLKHIIDTIKSVKEAIIIVTMIIGFLMAGGRYAANYIINHTVDEIIQKEGSRAWKMYRLQRIQDSTRFELAAELAAQVIVKLDSTIWELQYLGQQHALLANRINQLSDRLDADSSNSAQIRELIEIRRRLAEKEDAARRREVTEKKMREYIERSLAEIDRIKKGDRTP